MVVSNKRSPEASREYLDQKMCVLNFSSASSLGVEVENGSNAQEEAICRCSTLFPCISGGNNAMNFNRGKAVSIKSSELLNLHINRTKSILDIAKANSDKVMILGTFWCGAF